MNSLWPTASSTGHYCNEGGIPRSIGTNSAQLILIHIYSKWISLSEQQQPLLMAIYYVCPTWRGESSIELHYKILFAPPGPLTFFFFFWPLYNNCTATGYPTHFDRFQASVCEKWCLLAGPRMAQKNSTGQPRLMFDTFWAVLASASRLHFSGTISYLFAFMKYTLDIIYVMDIVYTYTGLY